MTDVRRLAADLMESDWATPAAILVALIDDPALSVLPEDRRHLDTLQRCGCLEQGRPSAQGQRVGMVLRTVHGIEAWSSKLRQAN